MSHPASAADPRLAAVLSLRDEIAGIAHTNYAPQPELSFDVQAGGESASDLSYAWYNSFADARHSLSEMVHTVRSLLADLAPVVTVRTRQNGSSAATVIRYDGRLKSAWSVRTSSGLVDVHSASVQHTFELRMASSAAVGAAGGTLLAISAAAANPLLIWQAVCQARALLHALQRLQGLLHSGSGFA